MKLARFFALSFLALAVLPAMTSIAAGQASRPLCEYFPEDTAFYVEVPSVTAVIEGARGLGIRALWDDDAASALRMHAALLGAKESGAPTPKATLDLLARLADAVPGGVAFGAWSHGGPPQWLCVIETGGSREVAREMLTVLTAAADGAAIEPAEIADAEVLSAAGMPLYAVTTDGVTLMGNRGGLTAALSRLRTRGAAGSLASSVKFTRARSFLSPAGAYQATLDLAPLRAQMEAVEPGFGIGVALKPVLEALGEVDTVSLEGRFHAGGLLERVFVSMKSADSPLVKAFDRPAVDEARLSVVPRTALYLSAKRVDLAGLHGAGLLALAIDAPIPGADYGALAGVFERRTGMSVTRDVVGALGTTVISFVDIPEGETLASLATGAGMRRATLIEAADADRVRAALDALLTVAQNDPTFLDSLGRATGVRPKANVATLGELKIVYVTMPGTSRDAVAAAVSHGYLIVADSKETIKAVVDRLIAPGAAITDTADYARARAALAQRCPQLAYVNLDRAIDIIYYAVLPMVAPQLDAAFRTGKSPISSADIPPAYVVKRHIDGIAAASSASGNLMTFEIYGPVGGFAALPALGAAAAFTYGTHTTTVAALRDEVPPEKRRLHEIGKILQVASIERRGRFPDDLREVVAPELLHAPQDPGGEVDYIYVPGYTTSSPGGRVLVHERKGLNPGGRFVLFVDGRVEFVTESDFEALMNTSSRGN